MQTVMSQTPRANKIRVVTHVGIVEAPLPDNVGYSLGSNYSAPFEGQFLSGAAAKAAVFAGYPPQFGVSTTKFYSSPEPSEISFELEFNAYYDAADEVLIPVARLMVAALGIETTLQDLKEELGDMYAAITSRFGSALGLSGDEDNPMSADGGEIEERANELSEVIGFIRAPERPATIYVGNMFTLEEVYISSVTPQFSNVLDSRGYPLSATVSMTAVFRKSPLAGDTARAFGLGKVGTGALTSGFDQED